MAAEFPTVPTFTGTTETAPSGTTPSDFAAWAQKVEDEIVAIATYLGTRHQWGPAQQGFLAWNADPYVSTLSAAITNAGTLWTFRCWTPVAITVTNVHVTVIGAGVTLTSGQNFAALYGTSGSLLSTTGDQTTAWGSTGLKTMALGSAQAVPAGFFDVALFWNGTTGPSLLRMNNNAIAGNIGLTGNGMRAAQTNNTGLTTTMPGTLGTKTAHANGYWVGVS
jgi:hypothetical protein